MKKTISILFLIVSQVCCINAQGLGKHTYFHIDLASGDNYVGVFGTGIIANMGNVLTHSAVFEHSAEWEIYNGKTYGEKMGIKKYPCLGFRANDIFQMLRPSVKIGYVTAYPGSDFNWGFYAIGSYETSQFKVSPLKSADDYSKQKMQRCLLGGSLFAVIGGPDKPARWMVEAGARYNMSVGAEGALGNKDDFDNGITSHYSIKRVYSIGGANDYGSNDIGLYVDVNHFDFLKSDAQSLKRFSIGFSYCFKW